MTEAPGRGPKYLRIHAELRDRISSGQWPPGHPLPAQRDLAGEFGVSIMTLRQALQLLADDGLIATRHGRGTYVAARYSSTLATCAASPPTWPARVPTSAPGCSMPG